MLNNAQRKSKPRSKAWTGAILFPTTPVRKGASGGSNDSRIYRPSGFSFQASGIH
jgi:hypothetical protein